MGIEPKSNVTVEWKCGTLQATQKTSRRLCFPCRKYGVPMRQGCCRLSHITVMRAAVISAPSLFGCARGMRYQFPQCQRTLFFGPQDGFARIILPFGCSALELLRRPLSQET